jgi:SulP family sulfate permease
MNQEEISFEPLKKDFATYNRTEFRRDFWAGLAVTLLSIPQAIAYSIVVGLPPYCGLMSAIFGTGLAALLGSSRQLVLGPTNTTVLLVQAATSSILYKYYTNIPDEARGVIALEVMATLVFLMGIFQILAGVFKLGKVIQFVSFPVIVGYVLGAAFALACGQLFTIFGMTYAGDETTLIEKLRYLVAHIGELNPAAACVGLVSFLIYVTLRKLNIRAPASLVMILLVTALVYLFRIQDIQIPYEGGKALNVVGDKGSIEAVIPSLGLPLFELRLLNIIFPIAFAIALISMLETISIAKTIAASTGQRLAINQELFGLGVSNFMLSFFGSLPCSGSLSRTTLNYQSGAKTRFAALFAAIFAAILVASFGEFIQYIPLAALAALIIATAIRVVDIKQLKLCLTATHSDAFVLIMTFISCIFFSLHIAFYIGVASSVVLYLRKAAVPRVLEYFCDEETEEFHPMLESEKKLRRPIRLINIEGELFFGAVDLFQSTLKAITEDDAATRVFIIRLKHVRDFDATAATALRQLCDWLRKSNRHLIVSSIPASVWEVFEKAGLVPYIGRENLFRLDEANPQASISAAIRRAKALCE